MSKIAEIQVNNTILNMISPTVLSFDKTKLLKGEHYAKCIAVTKYPSNPEYGWLSKVTSLEGTISSIEFSPTDSLELISRCNEQIAQFRRDLNGLNDESIVIKKESAIRDIREMIQRIELESEVVGYINILLMIESNSMEKLEERINRVTSKLSAIGCSSRVLSLYQKEAYTVISPYGIPIQELSDISARHMPLSTFIGGFPNASSGINDGKGYRIGSTEDGKPIIIDTKKRGGDRTNNNWLVTGVPGVGKSTFIKMELGFEFALGSKVIILDAEKEYVDLTKNLGGKVINCGGGKGGKINILQVRPLSKIDEEYIDEDDYDYGYSSALALHFQTVRTFFRLYKKSITDIELAKLEEILEKTYERFGISWDTDINNYKATQFPILSDLFEDIKNELKEYPNNEVLQNLHAYVRSLAIGADSYIFNGHTDIELDTSIIDLDVYSLLDGDENVLKAQFHNINSFVWHQISYDRLEEILYVIDEGHLYIDSDNTYTMKSLKSISKRIRKYNGGFMFITHAISDLLDPSIKRYGQAIIDNACYKFLMGTDGKNLEETFDLLNLTEIEKSILQGKQRGKGLLCVGSVRLVAKNEVTHKMLSLMGDKGGK